MKTQEKLTPKQCQTSACSAPDSPAKAFPLPESAVVLKMREARSFLRSRVSLKPNSLRFSYLKTFPDCLAMTKDGHLQPSSARYQNWGTVSSGRCLTASISESHSHASGCTLSDILIQNVPEKYYLSPEQTEKLLYRSSAGHRGKGSTTRPGSPAPSSPAPGGGGGKTGLYLVSCSIQAGITGTRGCARTLTASYCKGISSRQVRDGVLLIKEATKRGYSEAEPGDSVDISYAGQNKKRARVGHGVSYTLTTHADKAVVGEDLRIHRLVPRECLRLQGFSDEQIDKLLAVTSDTQAYRQAGNAVTVNVVHALGLRIKAAYMASAGAGKGKEAA